ncbi:MAG: DUF5679 domain-containing protein [Patescibacteria group bacterium]
MATKGRCMRCKDEREMKDEKEITMKGKGGSERRAATGFCSQCNTKMFKFLPSIK